MIVSTMLQLKISRTKKRLSNTSWYLPVIVLASMGLLVTLSFMLRASSLAGMYGVVKTELPVLQVPFDGEKTGAKSAATINDATPVVFLTKDRFIFGKISSFTSDITEVRQKFTVPHVKGIPHLEKLNLDLAKWYSRDQSISKQVAVLVPTGHIPMPIVIQTLQSLSQSSHFSKVILGGGPVVRKSDKHRYEDTIQRTKERLEEAVKWYPFPAMIGFMLVMILSGHLLVDLNPRLGAKVDVIPLGDERYPDGGIWLGVYEERDRIHVVTTDRSHFSWAKSGADDSSINQLIQYLKVQALKEAEASILKMQVNRISSAAVIAVDQRLKYSHIQPVIHALGQANISSYGFETRIIRN